MKNELVRGWYHVVVLNNGERYDCIFEGSFNGWLLCRAGYLAIGRTPPALKKEDIALAIPVISSTSSLTEYDYMRALATFADKGDNVLWETP